MGQFGKGLINSRSGRMLLELLAKQDLFLTNTTFNHKIAHRTTWMHLKRYIRTVQRTALESTKKSVSQSNRLAYVIMKNVHRSFVTDSRSYGGITTYTDHKFVKVTITFTWWWKKMHPAHHIKNVHTQIRRQIKNGRTSTGSQTKLYRTY